MRYGFYTDKLPNTLDGNITEASTACRFKTVTNFRHGYQLNKQQ